MNKKIKYKKYKRIYSFYKKVRKQPKTGLYKRKKKLGMIFLPLKLIGKRVRIDLFSEAKK